MPGRRSRHLSRTVLLCLPATAGLPAHAPLAALPGARFTAPRQAGRQPLTHHLGGPGAAAPLAAGLLGGPRAPSRSPRLATGSEAAGAAIPGVVVLLITDLPGLTHVYND